MPTDDDFPKYIPSRDVLILGEHIQWEKTSRTGEYQKYSLGRKQLSTNESVFRLYNNIPYLVSLEQKF